MTEILEINQVVPVETESRFRLIIVAALRAKQLLHGAQPRIETDIARRKNTSIAMEEVRRGLVHFEKTALVQNKQSRERPIRAAYNSSAPTEKIPPQVEVLGSGIDINAKVLP
jgi:DNA-directed RNA polymerase omega subunit